MPRLKFKKPCNDCPFRRASTPGWTGGAPPEWFVDSALADFAQYHFGDGPQVAPCHQTVDYTDPNWEQKHLPDAAACVGSLIFCKNNAKSPRDPERSLMVSEVKRDTEEIFTTAQEMIDHHRRPDGMWSWTGGVPEDAQAA
jgi:hypothetical protein